MTSQRTFPLVDERPLNLISQIFENDPDYFNDPDCPYGQVLKDLFLGDVKFRDFDSHSKTGEVKVAMSDEDMALKITELHKKLEDYWEEVQDSDKSSDKNTFFRVSVSLMEKLVDLRTKVAHVRNIQQFIAETIAVMDEILDPNQKNVVMERLGRLAGPEHKRIEPIQVVETALGTLAPENNSEEEKI